MRGGLDVAAGSDCWVAIGRADIVCTRTGLLLAGWSRCAGSAAAGATFSETVDGGADATGDAAVAAGCSTTTTVAGAEDAGDGAVGADILASADAVGVLSVSLELNGRMEERPL